MIVPLTLAHILAAIVGGVLIGVAAGLFLLLSGRIARASGRAARALGIADKGPPWIQAAAFVVGLPAGTIAVWTLLGTPALQVTSSVPSLVIGGLLVGFATRLGLFVAALVVGMWLQRLYADMRDGRTALLAGASR